MLLKEIKNIFHRELDVLYPPEEVASFFYMLLEHHLGLERFILALDPDLVVSKEQEQPLFEDLTQLKLERPIQYIIGKAYFMDLEFKVDENVLIPRPETEELVRWIISEFSIQHSAFRILDIGTGSGCIAVALAKNLPETRVFALDVSRKILDVAQRNAKFNKVEIEFIEGDILRLKNLSMKFDVIISNPPYVRQLEKEKIHNNVKKFEPASALFVEDDEPLIFYRHIVDFASKNLVAGGRLYFEINQYLAKETQQLLGDQNFSEIELRKDIFGNDRMLKGVRNVQIV